MRVLLTITLLVFSILVNAQSADKTHFDSLVKVANPKAETDSVAVYILDGEYFTKYMENFSQKLAVIRHAQIKVIGYSPFKDCGYQPGNGTIWIRTYKARNSNKKSR